MHPNVHNSNVHNSQTVEGAEMPFNRQMDKEDVWSIYTMEYYSAIRKDDYSIFASTWIELEEVMLSEISQAEKDNCHMVSLIYGTQEIAGRLVGEGREERRGGKQKGEGTMRDCGLWETN